ncbi:MAG TPA: hypothetical protein VE077_08870 [Candidatus Methylomirabilis sp.]|nr:hypothetical protein [Candidatus Methylomirabilis sp.]
MSTATAATTMAAGNPLRPFRAILGAGLICGTLDGLSALVLSSGQFVRLFQFIASALIGPNSFKGGAATAALGVGLHYLIALTATAVYYAASRAMPILLERALPLGVLYGIAVHLFMQFVVLPMSTLGRRPFNARSFFIYLAVHMIVVGPTIALSLRRFTR